MRSGSLVTGLWQSLLKTHSETSITQISAYCLLCSNKQSYPHHVKYASTAHATDEAQRSSNSSANLREAVVKPVMKPRLAGAQASTLTTGTRSFLHGFYSPAGFFLTSAIPILMQGAGYAMDQVPSFRIWWIVNKSLSPSEQQEGRRQSSRNILFH